MITTHTLSKLFTFGNDGGIYYRERGLSGMPGTITSTPENLECMARGIQFPLPRKKIYT